MEDFDEVPQFTLPPVIELNTRMKIIPEKIDVKEIAVKHKDKLKHDVELEHPVSIQIPPVPRDTLALTWCPDMLNFDIEDDVIVKKLWILNSCHRIIYVQCCGFWNHCARQGASWCCYPYTRFHIAPGLKAKLTIKATPKMFAPIPVAYAALQLAAVHKRDQVTGYFVVPIVIKFNKYRIPCIEEGG